MVKPDERKEWLKPYGIEIATAGQVLLAASAEHYFVEKTRQAAA